jgi:hypothetical protein
MSDVADRREAITAAVEAYNRAHLQAPLPRPTARLLEVMFSSDDVCRQRLDALAVEGFARMTVIAVLRALIEAGLVSTQGGTSRIPNAYRLHLSERVPSSGLRGPRPRRREIEAAIAAYNAADPDILLPPDAVRLLTVMFRRSSVCQCTVVQLTAEGFSKSILSHLLRILTEAGFLSKDWRTGPAPNIYRLHLPPRAQP